MKKIGLAIAILGGVPIALIGLLFLAFILDIRLPVGGDKLYNDQFIQQIPCMCGTLNSVYQHKK